MPIYKVEMEINVSNDVDEDEIKYAIDSAIGNDYTFYTDDDEECELGVYGDHSDIKLTKKGK